jgi:hypothetical protein
VTTPTTSIAWPLAQQVATLIDAKTATNGVAVSASWPGDKNIKPEMMFVAELKAVDVQIPNSKAGRTQRVQTIEFMVVCMVARKRTADAAMDRLSELIGAVEDVFADDPRLGTDGVELAEITGYEFFYPETADTGYLASAHVECSVQTRLH